MASIHVNTMIDAPASEVWSTLRKFEGIETFLPVIEHSELEGAGEGAIRHCTMQDGGKLKERLEELDDEDRRLVYTILEAPMPVENYLSAMKVHAVGDDRCEVTWSATFDTPEEAESDLQESMRAIYEQGLSGLKKMHEA